MVIDITTFTLVDGADERAFLEADAAWQAELMAGPEGFVRRTTARNASRWAVVTMWWTVEMADAAAASTTATATRFRELVDGGSVRREVYETLE